MTELQKVEEIFRNACYIVLQTTLQKIPATESGAQLLLSLAFDRLPNCIIREYGAKFLPFTQEQRISREMPTLEVFERGYATFESLGGADLDDKVAEQMMGDPLPEKID